MILESLCNLSINAHYHLNPEAFGFCLNSKDFQLKMHGTRPRSYMRRMMRFMLIMLERPYLPGMGEPSFFQVTTEWTWPKCQNARSPIPKWYGLSSV